MLDVISIYEDAARDNVNQSENGDFGYDLFNRLSRRAELRLIDWLTGDVAGITPPTPYTTQKCKDWISFLITKHKAQFVDGAISKPEDYYQWENFYRIGNRVTAGCDDDEEFHEECDVPIEILDGDKFKERCRTHIDEIKPSYAQPIAKLIGNQIEANPKDIGSVTLEYIRYPKFASIKTKEDTEFNDVIADPATSTNYEWPEFARELLVWFITDTYTIHNREIALKKTNQETGKTVRG